MNLFFWELIGFGEREMKDLPPLRILSQQCESYTRVSGQSKTWVGFVILKE